MATEDGARKGEGEGDTIRGQFVPGGTAMGMNLGSMVLSTEMFGEDARSFRPARFLGGDAAKRLEREGTVELLVGSLPWAGGPSSSGGHGRRSRRLA